MIGRGALHGITLAVEEPDRPLRVLEFLLDEPGGRTVMIGCFEAAGLAAPRALSLRDPEVRQIHASIRLTRAGAIYVDPSAEGTNVLTRAGFAVVRRHALDQHDILTLGRTRVTVLALMWDPAEAPLDGLGRRVTAALRAGAAWLGRRLLPPSRKRA